MRNKEIPESEREGLILEAEVTYGDKPQWEKESKELLLSLEKEILDKKGKSCSAD